MLLRKKPFKPFCIVMRTGERYDVFDADGVALGRSNVFLYLPSDRRMAWLAEHDIELVYQPRRSACR